MYFYPKSIAVNLVESFESGTLEHFLILTLLEKSEKNNPVWQWSEVIVCELNSLPNLHLVESKWRLLAVAALIILRWRLVGF